MKKNKYNFDITGVTDLQAYYNSEFIYKATHGVKQSPATVLDFIEAVTTQTIDQLFSNDTVIIIKVGRDLVRVPRSVADKLTAMFDEEEKKEEKKPGFFKRIWNKLTGK